MGAGAVALSMPSMVGDARALSPISFKLKTSTGANPVLSWCEQFSIRAARLVNQSCVESDNEIKIELEGSNALDDLAENEQPEVSFGVLFSHKSHRTTDKHQQNERYFVISDGLGAGQSPTLGEFNHPLLSKIKDRKVAIVYADTAQARHHVGEFSRAVNLNGGKIVARIAGSVAENSIGSIYSKIPKNVDIVYHVAVRSSII